MGPNRRRAQKTAALCAIVALLAALPGCGAGLVGVIFGAKELSDATNPDPINAAPVISDVTLVQAKTSPATVRFVLTDRESDATDVDVSYSTAAGGGRRIARLLGLPTSPSGTRHAVTWDFAPELGTHLTTDVAVSVALTTGEATLLPEQEVGNDAPEVLSVTPPADAEIVGIAQLDLVVRDSSSDVVKLFAQYQLPGVDEAWKSATPAGSALENIRASRTGQPLTFFWDVKRDLGTKRREVVLRLAASDGLLQGAWIETRPLRVDNNDPPVATILAASFVSNPDQRRGIPVPFQVRDQNSDRVKLVFQWRRFSEPFPELPPTLDEIETILKDPDLRRSYHIATERPASFEGYALAPDPPGSPLLLDPKGEKARLLELASTASPLLAGGMVGRELEILRHSRVPKPVGLPWEIRSPVAAVPIGDGITALVLDNPTPGSFRLREIDLGSGATVREIATASEGDPSALVLEALARSALVAVNQTGTWKLLRVQLTEGKTDILFVSNPALPPGPVRSIALLGSQTAIATVGSSLVRIEISGTQGTRASVILNDLRTPWGVVADPLHPGRIYLAERDWPGQGVVGRVIAVDLGTLERKAITSRGQLRFERPESLALERRGTRLLVVTDAGGDGKHEVRGVDLGDGASSEVFEIANGLESAIGNLSTGPDVLRVLALTSRNDLALGGGVEQKRTIAAFEMLRKEATVDRPFEPRLELSRKWRITERVRSIQATPEGVGGVFVWDTEDVVPMGGEVAIRAIPFDPEIGQPGETDFPKTIKTTFSREAVTLGDAGSLFLPQAFDTADLNGDGKADLVVGSEASVACFFQKPTGGFQAKPDLTLTGPRGIRAIDAADLDGDGLEDLLVGDAASLLVYFQKSQGTFGPAADLTLGEIGRPRSVVACDLDSDGDLDIVTANPLSNDIKVCLQEGNGSRVFALKARLSPALPGIASEPVSIATGDLDGDGDLDLVSANEAADTLTVFFQGADGKFPESPSFVLGGPGVITSPESVAAGDLNGDGRLDIASANQLSGSLTVFFQREGGSFERNPDVNVGGLPGPRALALSDLNRDGALDLATVNVDRSTVAAFFQKGRGVFGAEPDLVLPGAQNIQRPLALLARDFDGDGRVDLATCNSFAHSLSLSHQGGAGEFSQRPDLLLGSKEFTSFPYSVAAGDLDGDGDFDLVAANLTTNDLAIFLQDRPGLFITGQSLRLTNGTGDLPNALPVDLDGDGRLELLGRSTSAGFMEVFFQERPGVFQPQSRLELKPIEGAGQVIASDVDRDGLLDIVVVNTDYLSVFFQQRPMEFALGATRMVIPLPLGSEGGPWGVAAGDFNGDGWPDMTSSNSHTDLLTVFFQTSAREFAPVPALAGGFSSSIPLRFESADLDGDGHLDIACGKDGDLRLYFGTERPELFEEGSHFPKELPGGPWGPWKVASGDLDDDGDVDLVASVWGFGGASWEGNLTVNFQSAPRVFDERPLQVLGRGEGHSSVIILDLDGDGDLDLVTTDSVANRIAVFYGSH